MRPCTTGGVVVMRSRPKPVRSHVRAASTTRWPTRCKAVVMADVLLGAISGMVFVIYGVFVLARPEQLRS